MSNANNDKPSAGTALAQPYDNWSFSEVTLKDLIEIVRNT